MPSNEHTINRDTHGLYVNIGGLLFRPEQSRQSLMWPVVKHGATGHAEGDCVPTTHVDGSLVATVGDEMWGLHGPVPEGRPTEAAYNVARS